MITGKFKRIAVSELDDTDPSGFDKFDAEKVNQTIDAINTAPGDKQVDKGLKQKLNYAKKNWPADICLYSSP